MGKFQDRKLRNDPIIVIVISDRSVLEITNYDPFLVQKFSGEFFPTEILGRKMQQSLEPELTKFENERREYLPNSSRHDCLRRQIIRSNLSTIGGL